MRAILPLTLLVSAVGASTIDFWGEAQHGNVRVAAAGEEEDRASLASENASSSLDSRNVGQTVAAVLCAVVMAVLTTVGGGGGTGAPVLAAVGALSAYEAVPLSQVFTLATASFAAAKGLTKRDSSDGSSLVDANVLILSLPMALLGTFLGAHLNLVCPQWSIFSLAALLLAVAAASRARAAAKMHRHELHRLRAPVFRDVPISLFTESNVGSTSRHFGIENEEIQSVSDQVRKAIDSAPLQIRDTGYSNGGKRYRRAHRIPTSETPIQSSDSSGSPSSAGFPSSPHRGDSHPTNLRIFAQVDDSSVVEPSERTRTEEEKVGARKAEESKNGGGVTSAEVVVSESQVTMGMNEGDDGPCGERHLVSSDEGEAVDVEVEHREGYTKEVSAMEHAVGRDTAWPPEERLEEGGDSEWMIGGDGGKAALTIVVDQVPGDDGTGAPQQIDGELTSTESEIKEGTQEMDSGSAGMEQGGVESGSGEVDRSNANDADNDLRDCESLGGGDDCDREVVGSDASSRAILEGAAHSACPPDGADGIDDQARIPKTDDIRQTRPFLAVGNLAALTQATDCVASSHSSTPTGALLRPSSPRANIEMTNYDLERRLEEATEQATAADSAGVVDMRRNRGSGVRRLFATAEDFGSTALSHISAAVEAVGLAGSAEPDPTLQNGDRRGTRHTDTGNLYGTSYRGLHGMPPPSAPPASAISSVMGAGSAAYGADYDISDMNFSSSGGMFGGVPQMDGTGHSGGAHVWESGQAASCRNARRKVLRSLVLSSALLLLTVVCSAMVASRSDSEEGWWLSKGIFFVISAAAACIIELAAISAVLGSVSFPDALSPFQFVPARVSASSSSSTFLPVEGVAAGQASDGGGLSGAVSSAWRFLTGSDSGGGMATDILLSGGDAAAVTIPVIPLFGDVAVSKYGFRWSGGMCASAAAVGAGAGLLAGMIGLEVSFLLVGFLVEFIEVGTGVAAASAACCAVPAAASLLLHFCSISPAMDRTTWALGILGGLLTAVVVAFAERCAGSFERMARIGSMRRVWLMGLSACTVGVGSLCAWTACFRSL